MATGWIDGLTWWHVYPLGFSGAEPESRPVHGVVHRLRHLAMWLDYARDLGCRGLQLGPILSSQSHGYDTIDHLHIDRRLGDEHDFEALVAGCRERGMHVMLEGVFGHVSQEHPMFQVARAAGPSPSGADAKAARWFRLQWPDGGGPPTFEGSRDHPGLVALNHDEPAVIDYVVHVMDHWLARGADGWHLDAAHDLPPAFWQQVLPRVRERHPGAWFVGDVRGADPWHVLAETGLDAVTAHSLWEPLWQSLNDTSYHQLAGQVDRLAHCLPEHPPVTYVGTHDVSRLASNLADPSLFGHAIAALFSLPGTPSIFYGDEQAFRGIREAGPDGEAGIRPMFPDTPSSLAPWGWPTYHLHQQLIAIRARNPWLTRARPEVLHVTDETLALRAVPEDGHARVLTTLLSLAPGPVTFDIPMPAAVVEAQSAAAGDSHAPAQLGARSWRIISHD